MNIKVAAFTVREKSYNICMYVQYSYSSLQLGRLFSALLDQKPWRQAFLHYGGLATDLYMRVCKQNKYSYFSTKSYVLGAQKNRLIETVLLSTHNIC